MKKVYAGLIFVLAGVFIVVAVVFGSAMKARASGEEWSLFGKAKLARSQSFSAEGLDEIDLDYTSDTVTVLTSSTGEVVLEEYMTNPGERELARISHAGGRLGIQQGERPMSISFGFNASFAKLYLPAGWAGDLRLATSSGSLRCEMDLDVKSLMAQSSSGSVRLQHVKAGGDVVMKASSGSLSAESVEAGGAVEMEATSGSIHGGKVTAASLRAQNTSGSLDFEEVRADEVRAKASSGGVRFERLEGNFDLSSTSGSVHVERGTGHGRAETSSGSVRISLEELDGDLALSTTSGGVRLEVPRDTGMVFEAETTSGSIHTPFDEDLRFNDRDNYAVGNTGGGTQHKVYMSASSGSVKVEWL